MPEGSEKKIALVTGGGTGVGAACAVALAAKGFAVAIIYRSSAGKAANVADECRALGVQARTIQGDVSDDASCRAMVHEAVDQWGGIDVLVNNAGTTHFADSEDLDALEKSHFLDITSVNVVGAYQMSRAAAPWLRESSIGAIVNVSSHSGFSGIGSSIAYAASKGALNTMTLSLARSLAPEIRVNAVCPGFVDTDWMAGRLDREALSEFKNKVADLNPLKRIVSPEDVADAVSWFSVGARSVTGQLLVIDSGNHLNVGNPL